MAVTAPKTTTTTGAPEYVRVQKQTTESQSENVPIRKRITIQNERERG